MSALLSLHMPKLVADFGVVPCSKACREMAFIYPTSVFLNRRTAARYRALASIIPGR